MIWYLVKCEIKCVMPMQGIGTTAVALIPIHELKEISLKHIFFFYPLVFAKCIWHIHVEHLCPQTDGTACEDPLGLENTLWADTVVASGTALGVVIYTGAETRSVMNTSQPSSKVRLKCNNS